MADKPADRTALKARILAVIDKHLPEKPVDWSVARGLDYAENGRQNLRHWILKDLVALLDAETGTGWQPIAMAPQMRKVMVSYVNALGKRRVVLACYYKAHSLEMDDDYAEVGVYNEATGESFAPEGWYEEHESDSPLMPISDELTHWQPLPAPPGAESGTESAR